MAPSTAFLEVLNEFEGCDFCVKVSEFSNFRYHVSLMLVVRKRMVPIYAAL